MVNDKDVEIYIKEFFEVNYEAMKIAGGHSMTEDVKVSALNQVLLYWRKLNELARKVTSTEEKLSLPDLITPKGKKFTIEGIVDIVQEDMETWLYDIKTHELEYIKSNKELYEQQLNVYAYIWQTLRKNQLNHTAIISTNIPDYFPKDIRQLFEDDDKLKYLLSKWEPVVDLEYEEKRVEETIKEFGIIVDMIHNNEFEAPDVLKLSQSYSGLKSHEQFGTRVCRNCDARYSCDSFREYALGTKGSLKMKFEEYYNDYGTDEEQEKWINNNLNVENIP